MNALVCLTLIKLILVCAWSLVRGMDCANLQPIDSNTCLRSRLFALCALGAIKNFCDAAKDWIISEIKTICKGTPSILAWTDENGFTALHWATINNTTPAIEVLLDLGANLEATSLRECFTPFHFAARYGYLELMQFFMDHGANVNALAYNNNNALHLAAAYGTLHSITFLYKQGFDLDAVNGSKYTAKQLLSLCHPTLSWPISSPAIMWRSLKRSWERLTTPTDNTDTDLTVSNSWWPSEENR